MPRRLLPRFRRAPNPPNIPELPPGQWSRIAVPADLAKLDYGAQEEEVRSRVQSIPSPWARMLLFKNALDSEQHPARALVENEILDGLQFLWASGQLRGAAINYPVRRIDELTTQARHLSERASDFTSALVELMPRWRTGEELRGLSSVVIATMREKALLASSPFTIIFTAEDAAGDDTGEFFKYATGAAHRRLKDRPLAFQRYVAQVLLPQLDTTHAPNQDVDWVSTRRLMMPWLEGEVQACINANPARGADLRYVGGTNWASNAAALGLSQIDRSFGGVCLFRREGAVTESSRWRLNVTRAGIAQPPLVVDRASFDGVFYDGAPTIDMPDTDGLDRSVLPRINVQYPWVDPQRDWFTDCLLHLEEPIVAENVSMQVSGNGPANAAIAVDKLLLPLRPEILKYFSPESLASMVSVTVHGEQVEVTLRLSVGAQGEPSRDLIIRKRYEHGSLLRLSGPSLAIWPSFVDDRWRDYAVFRYDSNASTVPVLEVVALRDGKVLEGDSERRSEHVSVAAYRAAPEALSIRSNIGSVGRRNEDCGLVVPRYREITRRTQVAWRIGIDFGTSNTVVTIRPDDQSAPTEFKSDDLLLALTKLKPGESKLLDGYFFPEQIAAGPFGTAVLHYRQIGSYTVASHGLGVRVNVPFSGYVQPDEKNAVVGDLKWSTLQSVHFLTSSFLRHVLASVTAHGIQNGVDPSRISVSWAYPRAFTAAQVNQTRNLWTTVEQDFSKNGLPIHIDHDPVDESTAILRHFVDSGVAGVAGRLTLFVDVGGGTSDIAAYAAGKALVLDSLMLGGRNLTGPKLQGTTHDRLRNPFVARFADWARGNQLESFPDADRALIKYLEDGQDHLAFSYLLKTEWFKANGHRFTGEQVCFHFQALVLYFYGGLFHYLGLTTRALVATGEIAPETLPHAVHIAGNGSKYLEWLTDLTAIRGENAFTRALGKILARAAGAASTAALPKIELSTKPKREVALGLVAGVRLQLDESTASRSPLIGESLCLPGTAGSLRDVAATDRLTDHDLIDQAAVPQVAWSTDTTEIERYHAALLEVLPSLASHDAHWNSTGEKFRGFFSTLPRPEIEQATRNRLHFVAMREGGFRGSMFALETAAVLERMMESLFETRGQTPAAGIRQLEGVRL